MNFQNAVLLIAAIYGVVELIKAIVPDKWLLHRQVTVTIVLVVSLGITLLLAQTAWAHEQVIGEKPLDELNFASQILVALMAAGAAAFSERALNTVKNIGDNQPLPLATVIKNIETIHDVHESQAGPVVTAQPLVGGQVVSTDEVNFEQ